MPMNKKSKKQNIEELVEKALNGTTIEMLWIDYKKSGSDWVLQVYIDTPSGVSFDHCSDASHRILDALEVEDPLGGDYKLEVSSAGVDRPLRNTKDFERFCGERIYVKLHQAVDGLKTFTGSLVSVHENQIELKNEADDKIYLLPMAEMAKATLKPILNFN